jgi:hypothetical protein
MFVSDEAKENLRSGGGSVSTLLTGVGSYFSSTHRTLCWGLIGLGALFLIVTIYLQMNRKTKTALPIHALTILSVLILIFGGYRDLHRPKPVQPAPAVQQVGPTNTAPVETHGDNSPAIGAGNGNSVTYATPAEPAKGKSKKK